MARNNNTSRSLIIMSKLQGWDPSKIDGVDYANNEYPEDRVTKGEQLHGPLPPSEQSTARVIDFNTPVEWNTPRVHSPWPSSRGGKHSPPKPAA